MSFGQRRAQKQNKVILQKLKKKQKTKEFGAMGKKQKKEDNEEE